jgi:hypothetical protein
MEEANLLDRRSKSINLELNVDQEMKRVRERWKTSVEDLRSQK